MGKMKVVYFERKRAKAGSMEILFSTIRKYLPESIVFEVFVPSVESRGVLKRLYIVIESLFHQGDVNHITGDIHFAALLLKRERTILTIHDCVSVMYSNGLKKLLLKFFWYTLPLKKVRYVTVISEKTKAELLTLVDFPQERIFVIPDCVSDRFAYAEKKEFNAGKPRILQVGTRSNKNLDRVCEALKNIPCVLDIVGEMTPEQKTVLQHNGIEFENAFDISEDELIKKYINADIVSFVSTYEGFGMPILEAQSVGRALLTSNISPMAEVAGEGACLVDPFDPADIRRGFVKIIDDAEYRNRIIGAGVKNVKKYRPQKIAGMYIELYNKILSAT
jgi:glycosyltransferase involved in cell wall biosynthesis